MVALLVAGFAAGIALHTAFTQGDTVFSGKPASNLGVHDGRLAPPGRTPNNVSSQAPKDDAEHYIAPLRFRGNGAEALAALRKVLDAMDRTRIVRHDGEYLHAEFRSKLMGYVDDVEFAVAEKEGVIHVRSASRLGRRDYGVNRARVEAIRRRFEAAQGPTLKA
ncbi:MAG: DUF1499 domain-containing protein [Betaproteobacteria bacterium]|nr:DUF1499 domain-containing protein [Betaproteobacteria bacterium]